MHVSLAASLCLSDTFPILNLILCSLPKHQLLVKVFVDGYEPWMFMTELLRSAEFVIVCLYYRVNTLSFVVQVVAPKKQKLKEAEGELAVQMSKLNEKRAQLKEVSGTQRIDNQIYEFAWTVFRLKISCRH